MTIFEKNSILGVWYGSEYAFRLFKLLYNGFKRDVCEDNDILLMWYNAKPITVFTSNKEFSYILKSYMEVQYSG